MTSRELPASEAQRLLTVLEHYRGIEGSLNCPLVCGIHGPLPPGVLDAAVNRLTERHEALRTTFVRRSHRLTQLVHEPRAVPWTRVDLSAEPDPERAAREELQAELRTRIDVSTWPTRARLWRLAPDEHLFCFDVHHLVTDLWSTRVLFEDLVDGLALALGDSVEVREPAWQPSAHQAWLAQRAREGALDRHGRYWCEQLAGMEPPRLLDPAPVPRHAGRESVRERIDVATAKELGELARRERTTLFVLMFSVFVAMIHRRTGQTDVAVASLFANRSRPELQRTVGFLVNLVLLRARLPSRPSLRDVLRAAEGSVRGAFLHQELPYHMLPRGVTVARAGRRADEVVFQMVAAPIERVCVRGGLRVEAEVPDVVGRFDLELALLPSPNGMALKLDHRLDRLERGAARAMAREYCALAAAAAAAPDVPVADFSVG
jgi:hypothetical protein